ncbi:hypothetical protein HYQ46_008871 [Verticillium longisporum]|nr:hypothetical protein HYQ46_008871 [Verticillium longisporum]
MGGWRAKGVLKASHWTLSQPPVGLHGQMLLLGTSSPCVQADALMGMKRQRRTLRCRALIVADVHGSFRLVPPDKGSIFVGILSVVIWLIVRHEVIIFALRGVFDLFDNKTSVPRR